MKAIQVLLLLTIAVYLPASIAAETQGLTVDTTNKEAVKTFYLSHYCGEKYVPTGWTGNIEAGEVGTVSDAYLEATRKRLEFYRALIGTTTPITFNSEKNSKSAKAALVLSANDSKYEFFPFPDETWEHYSDDAKEAVQRGTYFDDYLGPDAIDHLFYFGYAGLHGATSPHLTEYGFGTVDPKATYPKKSLLWLYNENGYEGALGTVDKPILWPPEGYLPTQLNPRYWMMMYPGADFREATVNASHNGTPLEIDLGNHYDDDIIFSLSGSTYNLGRDEDYKIDITISNVLYEEQYRDFSYSVTLFNPVKGQKIELLNVQKGLYNEDLDFHPISFYPETLAACGYDKSAYENFDEIDIKLYYRRPGDEEFVEKLSKGYWSNGITLPLRTAGDYYAEIDSTGIRSPIVTIEKGGLASVPDFQKPSECGLEQYSELYVCKGGSYDYDPVSCSVSIDVEKTTTDEKEVGIDFSVNREACSEVSGLVTSFDVEKYNKRWGYWEYQFWCQANEQGLRTKPGQLRASIRELKGYVLVDVDNELNIATQFISEDIHDEEFYDDEGELTYKQAKKQCKRQAKSECKSRGKARKKKRKRCIKKARKSCMVSTGYELPDVIIEDDQPEN